MSLAISSVSLSHLAPEIDGAAHRPLAEQLVGDGRHLRRVALDRLLLEGRQHELALAFVATALRARQAVAKPALRRAARPADPLAGGAEAIRIAEHLVVVLGAERDHVQLLALRQRHHVARGADRAELACAPGSASRIGSRKKRRYQRAASAPRIGSAPGRGVRQTSLRPLRLRSLHGSKAKIRFQSFCMSTTIQPLAIASSSALSRRPKSDVRS